MIYLAHFNFLQTTGIGNNKSQTGSRCLRYEYKTSINEIKTIIHMII